MPSIRNIAVGLPVRDGHVLVSESHDAVRDLVFFRAVVSCFAIAPEQYVMLGTRAMYAAVGGVEDLVGGPDTPSKVTVSFDLPSREAVDELIERAGAAGGRIGDIDDYPFMYQRQFDDPDGYHYSPFWMKPEAEPEA